MELTEDDIEEIKEMIASLTRDTNYYGPYMVWFKDGVYHVDADGNIELAEYNE